MNEGFVQLIIFTDQFPYGNGEKSFVGPEVDYLSRFHDITIVCTVGDETVNLVPLVSKLPNNVKVARFNTIKSHEVVLQLVPTLFDRFLFTEIKDIIRERKKIIGRIWASYKYLVAARVMHKRFYKRGLFNNASNKIFYTFWMAPYSLAVAIQKRSNNEMPFRFISRVHNYDLYNERAKCGRQPFQKIKARYCDKILFVSPNNLEYFIKNFMTTEPEPKLDRCVVARLGCFPYTGDLPKKTSEIIRIVSCSYVKKIKRVEIIAKALAELGDMNVEWIHFGDGPLLDEVKKISRKANINAHFPGFLDNKAIHEYYQNNYVDLFITTTQAEGSPVSIQEAMSYGIPIIGTNVGGIPEQINGNGFLLSENPTVSEVVEAVRSFISLTDAEKHSMRARSKEIWKEKYDLSRNLRSLNNLLESLN